MNIAQNLRKLYASPVGGVIPIPDTNGYIDDESLASCDERPPNLAAPDKCIEPLNAPWHTGGGQISGISADRIIRWRVDGATDHGRRYYASPISLLADMPPRLVDIFIPDQTAWPPDLRNVLDASKSVHMMDQRVSRLGISKHLIRALEYWSSLTPDFEAQYQGLPYGSSIMVENITTNFAYMRIHFQPKPQLVEDMLSLERLQSLWDFTPDTLPPVIALEDLQFKAQLQKSVVLVQLPSKAGGSIAVLKSRPDSMKCLYHEIRNLLKTPDSLNILVRLLYLVTIQSPITGEVHVCGCILRYHEPGALHEVLPQRRLAGKLSVQDSLRWAKQLTSALIHIVYSVPRQFIPDLKMDNIVLSPSDVHGIVLLIDHEQDRTTYANAPPEICYIDWLYTIADADSLDPAPQTKFKKLLNSYLERKGVLTPFQERDLPYHVTPHGFYFPWLACSDEEREAAQVFLLGKALWCIFEGVGQAYNNLGRSILHEPEFEFPEFRRTPEALRSLIKKCMTGAREWSTGPLQIYRRESRILPRGRTGLAGEPVASFEETMLVLQWTWQAEVDRIIGFVEAKQRYDNGDPGPEDFEYLGYLERPKLQEVLEELESFQI